MSSYFDSIIDFHTHTVLSDGALIPAEQVRAAQVCGYGALGISDHVDAALLEPTLLKLVRFRDETNPYFEGEIVVFANVELTHIPPKQIQSLTARARACGANLVLMHGETRAEAVAPGTNYMAIEAGVDILAHPGFISEDEAALAKERGVYLEITYKRGHSLTNGHVAAVARKTGAKLVIASDSHGPDEFLSEKRVIDVARGAGLTEKEIALARQNARDLAERAIANMKRTV